MSDNDVSTAILVQATGDVMKIYRGVRDALGEVNEERRDMVAATLTHAILTRMTQIADSID